MTVTIKTLCGLTLGIDRDLRMVYPLTRCHEASGKGGQTGVVCRACYMPVDDTYGNAIMLDVPGAAREVAEWIDRLTDCPVPGECAEHVMWTISGHIPNDHAPVA